MQQVCIRVCAEQSTLAGVIFLAAGHAAGAHPGAATLLDGAAAAFAGAGIEFCGGLGVGGALLLPSLVGETTIGRGAGGAGGSGLEGGGGDGTAGCSIRANGRGHCWQQRDCPAWQQALRLRPLHATSSLISASTSSSFSFMCGVM